MPLTQEQINHLAKHRAEKSRKLKRFDVPESQVSTAAEYMRDMRRLTKMVTDLVNRELMPVLEEYENIYAAPETHDDFGSSMSSAFSVIEKALLAQGKGLNAYALKKATKFVGKTNKFNRKKWVSEINKLAGIDIRGILNDETIKAQLLDSVDANVKLIKTLQPEYLADVRAAVLEGTKRGDDFFSIKKRVAKLKSTHERFRPKLIARDQSNKLTGDLNRIRQQDIGVEKYIWRTSKDGAVRDSHRDNDGKEFFWNSRPPETGHPGEDIQCRCIAEPVFDDWLKGLQKKQTWTPDDPAVLERHEDFTKAGKLRRRRIKT
jgi:SPP1 gp7 family putative phage head morphogenesis protein